MVMVGAVLSRMFRHANDHEHIHIDRKNVAVIQRRGRREWRDEFLRYWTGVTLERLNS